MVTTLRKVRKLQKECTDELGGGKETDEKTIETARNYLLNLKGESLEEKICKFVLFYSLLRDDKKEYANKGIRQAICEKYSDVINLKQEQEPVHTLDFDVFFKSIDKNPSCVNNWNKIYQKSGVKSFEGLLKKKEVSSDASFLTLIEIVTLCEKAKEIGSDCYYYPSESIVPSGKVDFY